MPPEALPGASWCCRGPCAPAHGLRNPVAQRGRHAGGGLHTRGWEAEARTEQLVSTVRRPGVCVGAGESQEGTELRHGTLDRTQEGVGASHMHRTSREEGGWGQGQATTPQDGPRRRYGQGNGYGLAGGAGLPKGRGLQKHMKDRAFPEWPRGLDTPPSAGKAGLGFSIGGPSVTSPCHHAHVHTHTEPLCPLLLPGGHAPQPLPPCWNPAPRHSESLSCPR